MKSQYEKPEILRMIQTKMQPDNALALEVGIQTGMRIGDILSLRYNQINGNTITYIASKTGKQGITKINNKTAKQIKNNSNGVWLFPSKITNNHKTRQAVYTDMIKASKYYGVTSHISPHSTRKCFAVETNKTKGINAVKKALQHDNINTTRIYTESNLNSLGFDEEEFAETIADIIIKKLIQERMFLFKSK